MSLRGLKVKNQIDMPVQPILQALKENVSPIKKKISSQKQSLSVRQSPTESNETHKEFVAPFQIFTDLHKKICNHCNSTKNNKTPKSNTDDLLSLLCDDSPPDSYYKELAEVRMSALKETLEENEALYQRIATLQDELDQYRLFAEQLKEIQKILPDVEKETEVVDSNNDTVIIDSD